MNRNAYQFAVLLLCPCVCIAAPVPKDESLTVTYPTKVGTEWVYQEGDSERKLKLTSVERKNGAEILEISEWREAEWRDYEKISQSKAGLFRIESLGLETRTPVRTLTVPARRGDKWGLELTSKAKATSIVDVIDTVSVPAGRFRAISVKRELDYGDGSASRCVCWYADKIGLVKMVYNDEPPVELKSFVLGKN